MSHFLKYNLHNKQNLPLGDYLKVIKNEIFHYEFKVKNISVIKKSIFFFEYQAYLQRLKEEKIRIENQMKPEEQVQEQVKIQGSDGNWNYDPYMQGMFNGLECALATIEQREPQYKTAPKTWLKDMYPQLSESKPEWQIEAEKNGWEPPQNIGALNERANQIIGRADHRGVRDQHADGGGLGLPVGRGEGSVSKEIL